MKRQKSPNKTINKRFELTGKVTDTPLADGEHGCLGEVTQDRLSTVKRKTNQLRKLEWIYSYLFVLSSVEMLIYNGPVANDPVMRVWVHVLV